MKGDIYLNEWGQHLIGKFRHTRSIADIGKKRDLSDMPGFRYVEQTVSERLPASLRYFLLLAIFNGVFFMAACVAFSRSGVYEAGIVNIEHRHSLCP